jgi:Tfp pilus assembly PilM family ATPase
MAQRIVAVEISPRVARLVVLETTLRHTEVVEACSLPLPEGADRRQALAVAREAIVGSVDSLVLSTDPRTVTTRLLHFPFGDLRRVEAAVAFELEGQVPYDIQQTALTWHVASRTPTSMEVLTALSPKKQVAELVADADASGLTPRVVMPATAALLELAPHDEPAPLAIVAMGETTTHVAIVRNGELRLARTLRAGGADVDRAIAKAFRVELAAAKQAKESEVRLLDGDELTQASPDARRVSEAAMAGLAAVVTGLATTFKALPTADAPTRVFLTGGLALLPGLKECLGRRLGLPVDLVDLQSASARASEGPALALFDRLLKGRKRGEEAPSAAAAPPRPTGPPLGPEMALALGMAIAVARHGRNVPLNFRRGELAYQGDLQLYRGQVTRIAAGVAAVIVLAIAGAIVRYTMISAEERRINAGFCAATKKIIGREICDPTAALATLRQAPGAAEGVVIPPYSAAALLEMMSKAIGSDIDVSFDDLELRVDGRAGEPDRVTGKGDAATFETTEQVSQALKRDPCVQEVEISKQRKSRDGGRVEFSLSIKVSCPPGATPGHPVGPPAAHAESAQWQPAGAVDPASAETGPEGDEP